MLPLFLEEGLQMSFLRALILAPTKIEVIIQYTCYVYYTRHKEPL